MELADIRRSKRRVRKGMRVQVPPELRRRLNVIHKDAVKMMEDLLGPEISEKAHKHAQRILRKIRKKRRKKTFHGYKLHN